MFSSTFLFLSLLLVSTFSLCFSLRVHLVAHTHDDYGWLKTPNQYYYRLNNSIQEAGVKYILDSVVLALAANPDRKFVYVEQGFFHQWWGEQNAETKQIVRQLVNNGQLEFLNGGWTMPDEASAYYGDMIDNAAIGHKFLLREFGVIPRVGWQIDPFGHSAFVQVLNAECGFESLFFGRIDYQDRNLRMANKAMEFIWRGSPSLGSSAELFAGAFQSGNYGPPTGFCFDQFCNDQPIQDNPNREDYNVKQLVDAFVSAVEQQAEHAIGDDIMLEMGSDFQYENANLWFTSLDKLIAAVNADGRLQAFYSTPLNYTRSKMAYQSVNWPLKTDDFFPYADYPHAYWTGYFTSRPALKRYVRVSSSILQFVRQVEYLTGESGASDRLWAELSGCQHHDAVSGTAKQHVTFDYARRLSIGNTEALQFAMQGLAKLVTAPGGIQPDFTTCQLANISVCAATSNASQPVVLLVYNPTAHSRSERVSFPLSSASFTLLSQDQSQLPLDVLPVFTSQALNSHSLPFTGHFQADLPALGYQTYFLIPAAAEIKPEPRQILQRVAPRRKVPAAASSIANDLIRLTFDPSTGLLVSLTDLATGVTEPFAQEFFAYYGMQNSDQNSGAYIFRPTKPNGTPYPIRSGPVSLSIVSGSSGLVFEARQVFASWAVQIIRLSLGSRVIEFDWTIGPVDVSDLQGREIITRYSTGIQSNGTWQTDANGREMQQRVRNYRPSWHWIPTEPVAGNYYPATTAAQIQDSKQAMAVLIDRSQGVASLQDGQLELMIHRRLLVDDSRGVGEPINETDYCTPYDQNGNGCVRYGRGLIVTGVHRVVFAPAGQLTEVIRPLQQRVYQSPVLSFAPLDESVSSYASSHSLSGSSAASELPPNVELTTLQLLDESGDILVRLSHSAGVNEDPNFSGPAAVDLQSLFVDPISAVQERSISDNQPIQQIRNIKRIRSGDAHQSFPSYLSAVEQAINGTQIVLGPMQIRTFRVQIKQNANRIQNNQH